MIEHRERMGGFATVVRLNPAGFMMQYELPKDTQDLCTELFQTHGPGEYLVSYFTNMHCHIASFKLVVSKACNCDLAVVLNRGCQCGGL